MENVWGALGLVLVATLMGGGILELFIRLVLPHFLSDAQRYGIDENCVAQTPDYLARKHATNNREQRQMGEVSDR